MVLLAGAALSFSGGVYLFLHFAQAFGGLWRAAAAYAEYLPSHAPAFWRATHDHLRNTLWYSFQIAEMFLMGLTPAFIVVRLTPPRPSLRALLNYAGTLAGLAMVFGLFWVTGFLHYLLPGKIPGEIAAAIAVGATVAIVWVAVALCGGWEVERGWIDGLGRLLGAAAIGTGVLGLVVFKI
jgi:hypothetical protein